MTSIFLLTLILTCQISAKCIFKDGQISSLSDGLDCFRSIPLDKSSEEFTSTINLLKTYLQSYTFVDTSLNPNVNKVGYDQSPVDIFTSLDEIEQTSFNNTFDFYERIMVLLNNLKDAHTYFFPPCIQKFAYVLPYIFSIYQNGDLTQNVKVHIIIQDAHKVYIKNGGVDFEDDTEIIRINLKGKPIYSETNELNDGTYLASEAIAHWADEQVSTARSPVTRQNIAASGFFSYRFTAMYPHPEYENITVEYKLPNGTVSTTQLPFYVYQISSLNSFEDECPLEQDEVISNDEIGLYFFNELQIGIIVIPTFNPEDEDQFLFEIFRAVSIFKDISGEYFAQRIIIDVQSNPGGMVYLGAQTLRFLFPQAGHPIYPVVDQVRTPLNKEIAALDEYLQINFRNRTELMVNPEDMSIDNSFYRKGGRTRKTQSSETEKSLTVELTEKYGFYMNHLNNLMYYSEDWDWKRRVLFNPEDVLVITDGMSASTCSQFIKAIQQKHLARIVTVGVRDPRQPNLRQDISIASSGSAIGVDSIQEIKNYKEYAAVMNISNIPGNYIRSGIEMGFADRGLYGFTDGTKDQLMEYRIVDADFRYEVAPNLGETPQDESGLADFYSNILDIENEILGNVTNKDEFRINEGKKCLSWEVDFVQASSKGNCRGCLRGDQHSVFGYPCSSRGITEQEGRNIDGTSKIGVFDEEQCVFSHCKIGYYRKNIDVNGSMKDQCVLIPLGYKEERSEMTPDQREYRIQSGDKCGTTQYEPGPEDQPKIYEYYVSKTEG
ncbi:MAG: hypothetical protein EZS28_018010 [Streblomastix strix]|uniref:Uncharacterized protein n=1 Tax=Streblomastix strix TaxID=222440 RepID=A0A5J4VUU6_9EUKA|nr:MAG: hypothetical protein EZS28_018010 [Streblomastix strix]